MVCKGENSGWFCGISTVYLTGQRGTEMLFTLVAENGTCFFDDLAHMKDSIMISIRWRKFAYQYNYMLV